MAKTISSLNVVLGATVNPFVNAFKTAEDATTSFVGVMGRAAGVIATVTGAGLALQALDGIFNKVFSIPGEALAAAQKQTDAETKLGAVLRATGGAAGFSQQALIAHATALEHTSTFGRDAIVNLQAVLSTFQGVSGPTFQRATQAALDLSSVFGGDLQAAALHVGKALTNPAEGLTALRKVSVTFTAQQQEQIKGMEAIGNLAGAQAIILNVLQAKFGGVAAAMAATPFGRFIQLGNDMTDLLVSVGDVLANVGATFATAFNVGGTIQDATAKVDGFAGGIERAASDWAPSIAAAATNVYDRVTTTFGRVYGFVVPVVARIYEAVAAGVMDTVAFVENNAGAVATTFGNVYNAIAAKVSPLIDQTRIAFGRVYDTVTTAAGAVYDYLKPVVQAWYATSSAADVVNQLVTAVGAAYAVYKLYETALLAGRVAQLGYSAAVWGAGAAITVMKTAWAGIVIASYGVAAAQWAARTAIASGAIQATVSAVASGVASAAAVVWTGVTWGAQVAAAALAAVLGIGSLAQVGWAVVTAVASAGQVVFAGALAAVEIAVGTLAGAFSLASIATAAWSVVTGVATAAQWLLNIALTANPIGIVVAGIAALLGVTAGFVVAAGGVIAVATGIFNKFVDVNTASVWFSTAFDVAKFAAGHLSETLKLVGAELGLFAVRSAAQITYAFTVAIPAAMEWLGRNWKAGFDDILRIAEVTFDNLGTNVKNFTVAMWEALKGNGFHFDWTSLEKGFQSTMKAFPQLAERQVGPLEQKMAATADAMKKAFEQHFADWKAGKPDVEDPTKGAQDAADAATKKAKDAADKAKAQAEQDSKDAIAKAKADADAAMKAAGDAGKTKYDTSNVTGPLDAVTASANNSKAALKGLEAVVSGSAASLRMEYAAPTQAMAAANNIAPDEPVTPPTLTRSTPAGDGMVDVKPQAVNGADALGGAIADLFAGATKSINFGDALGAIKSAFGNMPRQGTSSGEDFGPTNGQSSGDDFGSPDGQSSGADFGSNSSGADFGDTYGSSSGADFGPMATVAAPVAAPLSPSVLQDASGSEGSGLSAKLDRLIELAQAANIVQQQELNAVKLIPATPSMVTL